MKREDIEKAARYAINKHYNCGMCCDRTDCEHCYGYNTAYDCQECGADEFKEGFLKGADWRINSVWHDAGETPRPHKNAVAQTKKYGALLLGPDMDETTYKWLCKTIGITSWAYIGDLLPNMEE